MEETLNQVRGMLQETPSRANWLLVLEELEKAYLQNPEQTEEILLPYLSEHASDWDSKFRMAPVAWTQKLVEGTFPVSFLSVVSAMTVVPYFGGWQGSLKSADFLNWVSALPKDCPALEGLHWKYRGDVSKELGIEWPEQQSEKVQQVLKSPLCRELRVLDLSLWEIFSDPFSGNQDDFCGFLRLEDIAAGLSNPTLEVLMLFGQRNDPPRNITAKHWKALANLKALDIGGGFPIGHTFLKNVTKKLSALESLNIRHSSDLGDYITENFLNLEEDTRMEIQEYWWIYESNYKNYLTSGKQLEKLKQKYEQVNFVNHYDRDGEENKPFQWTHYFEL